MNAPLDEIERLLRTQGREMTRAMMQAHFDQRAAQDDAPHSIQAGGHQEAARSSWNPTDASSHAPEDEAMTT
ncbi:MAG TPA: hypothetical protein VH165_16745 [Kofleriaceae bacterium]|nr:hypothetical protein [Kofleriaceae bacterium]